MAWNVNLSKEELALLLEAGFIYRDTNRFQEARDVFEGVQALLPQNEVVDVALGTVEFHQGHFDTAIKHYAKALEKNGRSAYAYAHLGEAYLFKLKKQEARQYLSKAIELDPRGDFGRLARSLLEFSGAVQFES
jgi:tetratricopeptide (TPR) repeat protein